MNERDPHWLQLRWRIEGTGDLIVPPPAGNHRRDGLWQATCFELFLRPDSGSSYCEFNFSPSEAWAAYDFDDWREGMQERPVERPPVLTIRRGGSVAIFEAAIPRAILPDAPCAMSLTAVIEEAGGTKSYWALAHPDTPTPDFHAAPCFAARLEAPRGA